jgi:hypothetical protein
VCFRSCQAAWVDIFENSFSSFRKALAEDRRRDNDNAAP